MTIVARIAVIPLTAAGVALTFVLRDNLVQILLIAFVIPMQLAPALLLGTFWLRVHRRAVIAGLAAGVATLVAIGLEWHAPPAGVYAGLWALLPNLAIVVAMSARRRPEPRTVERYS
jgi:Na+/proline symporter